ELLFPAGREADTVESDRVEKNERLDGFGVVEGKSGDRSAAHGVTDEREIAKSERPGCLIKVAGKRLHPVIIFRGRPVGIARAAVANRDRPEARRVEGVLSEPPDTPGRLIAVNKHDGFRPFSLLEVLQPHSAGMDEIRLHLSS